MADAPPAIPEITEEELAKRKKKIEDAFALFDKEGKGCLIQEEVSTVMRYHNDICAERIEGTFRGGKCNCICSLVSGSCERLTLYVTPWTPCSIYDPEWDGDSWICAAVNLHGVPVGIMCGCPSGQGWGDNCGLCCCLGVPFCTSCWLCEDVRCDNTWSLCGCGLTPKSNDHVSARCITDPEGTHVEFTRDAHTADVWYARRPQWQLAPPERDAMQRDGASSGVSHRAILPKVTSRHTLP